MPIDTTTPKSRFLKSKERVEAHRSIIGHPQFEDSIATALLEFQDDLSRGNNIENAGARHFQISGALQFVRVLKNLSEIPEQVRQTPPPTLKHTA